MPECLIVLQLRSDTVVKYTDMLCYVR